jgi:hypothetical protein
MQHSTETLPALSIRQPWVHAILHLGKDVENRKWPTRHRGPLVILAAKGFGKSKYLDAARFIEEEVGAEAWDALPPFELGLKAPSVGY